MGKAHLENPMTTRTSLTSALLAILTLSGAALTGCSWSAENTCTDCNEQSECGICGDDHTTDQHPGNPCGDAGIASVTTTTFTDGSTQTTWECNGASSGESGDTYITIYNYEDNSTTTVNITNISDSYNEYYGDEGGDDTGEPEPVENDEIGTWGCIRLYDASVQSYIASFGAPAGLELDDYDSDGNVDQVWMNPGFVLSFEDYGFVDLDSDGAPDQSDWICASWADGTDDDIDNDGDGYTENEGDMDDRSSANSPVGTRICGDLLSNRFTDWEGSCVLDDDSDGYSELDGDCDDGSTVYGPDAYEYDAVIDYDCDGITGDQDDFDGDRYCSNGYYDDNSDGQCEPSETVVTADCNDSLSSVSPGSPELMNWVDDDCDGALDNGCSVECSWDYVSYHDGTYDVDGDGADDLGTCWDDVYQYWATGSLTWECTGDVTFTP